MTLGLSESCRSFRLEGAVLVCECLLADGKTHKTSCIDLDHHIGNVNGSLVWHEKEFSKTCKDFRLEGTILHAKCKKSFEEWIDCSIDLALNLRNDDGVLM